jgi:hypothetical protein
MARGPQLEAHNVTPSLQTNEGASDAIANMNGVPLDKLPMHVTPHVLPRLASPFLSYLLAPASVQIVRMSAPRAATSSPRPVSAPDSSQAPPPPPFLYPPPPLACLSFILYRSHFPHPFRSPPSATRIVVRGGGGGRQGGVLSRGARGESKPQRGGRGR